ncbi:hypothetical protein RUMLAC_01142 [[Ruminococcus] lactaris ATCC 29176]|uniref:Uncharacterized protein n=1 Tax=[Ruminococcus] lactaris ATCC 29176 TaxID=471875 RepID=B5CNV2_9FIRM|nr:hypothetical protein RUMLAC_01142 [[Ruminococcus] lactaris ATCC 29176]
MSSLSKSLPNQLANSLWIVVRSGRISGRPSRSFFVKEDHLPS